MSALLDVTSAILNMKRHSYPDSGHDDFKVYVKKIFSGVLFSLDMGLCSVESTRFPVVDGRDVGLVGSDVPHKIVTTYCSLLLIKILS